MPEESQIHFLVEIPRSEEKEVKIYERFKWLDGDQVIDYRFDVLKVTISLNKWNKIKDVLKNEFNPRLKAKKYSISNWKVGKNPVHRLLGKELMLLGWVVADCDPSMIDIATRNWLGLRPEERWWLYTMTNATSGGIDDDFGWRKAIRYALTENPISDSSKPRTLFTLNDEEL